MRKRIKKQKTIKKKKNNKRETIKKYHCLNNIYIYYNLYIIIYINSLWRIKMLISYLLGKLRIDDNGNPGLEIFIPKTSHVSKHVDMSVDKARRVAHILPNSTYFQAVAKLSYLPYRACKPILQILRSAAVNLYENNNIDFYKYKKNKSSHVKKSDFSDLFVLSAEVTKGPILKRVQPRARGRGYPIQKSTSFIKITLGFYKRYQRDQDIWKKDYINNSYYKKLHNWMIKKKNTNHWSHLYLYRKWGFIPEMDPVMPKMSIIYYMPKERRSIYDDYHQYSDYFTE
uniref:50S ribosomal protein L22, chloroplastic n=1 Tax=Callitris pyramidalis TaxID=214228 RepID=A0A8F8SSZ2_9CONI|nr:ribosomal protein L22 [Callitris pyramidalis]